MTENKFKELMGLKLLDLEEKQWLKILSQHLDKEDSELKLIMTPNPEQIMLMRKDEKFGQYLKQADWLIADGWGLVWAAKLKQRLTGIETVEQMLKLGIEKNYKMLLIGGRYAANDEDKIRVKIGKKETDIYYIQGYQNILLPTHNEAKEVERSISDISPDVVWVALGAPKQEEWLIEHRDLLRKSKVKIAMAVGGSFDFILGKIKRAPVGWQKMRLEWLWRLIQEPRRIKRQLVLPQFVYLKWRGKIK